MAKAIPYLLVKNGKKAIKLYEDLFDAKLVYHQPFSEEIGKEFGFPDGFNYDDSTMHAELEIYGTTIYLADNSMGPPFESSGNVEITLNLESKQDFNTIYKKAKRLKSTIKMEAQQTFWGAWFARFEDTEKIAWQLNFSEEQ